METRQKPPCEEAISGPCPGSTTRPPYPTPTYGPCWTIQLDPSPAATLPSDHYHHGDGTRHGLGKQDHPLGQTWQTVGAFFFPDYIGQQLLYSRSPPTLPCYSTTAALLQPLLSYLTMPYYSLTTVLLSPFLRQCCTPTAFLQMLSYIISNPGVASCLCRIFAWVRIPPLCPHNPPLLPAAQHQCGVPEVPVHPRIGGASETPHHLHLGGVQPEEE